MDKIRLSVVDDHPMICMGLAMMLRQNKDQSIELVNTYSDGTQVINNMENLNTDVFLIDLSLPDIMGYKLAERILEVYPEMKIGIYTYMVEKEYILNSFKCGVLGYILKSAGPKEIIDSILVISKGEKYIRGEIVDILFAQESIFRKYEKLNITKRESEILQLIVSGLRNKEIADKLSIAERTVEFHKQNLYEKFDVSNPIQLYKAVQQLNVFPEEVS